MSWTLMKKLDTFVGPGEIKKREVVLGPQGSPEEITSFPLFPFVPILNRPARLCGH